MNRTGLFLFIAVVILAVAAYWFVYMKPKTDAAATDPWPGVASAYLVRIDGEVRWAANDAARLKPASLTKMMTAVLVVLVRFHGICPLARIQLLIAF